MKKVFTAIFLVSLSTIGISQSIAILDDIDSTDVSSSIYDIIIPSGTTSSTGKEFLVANNSVNEIDSVRVRAYFWTMDAGDASQMCWGGVCDAFGVTLASQRLNIISHDTVNFINNGFHSLFNASANCITRLVHYVFFLENNPSDSTGITIRYICTTGINEETKLSSSISDVFPNPINSTSLINYNFKNIFENAKIIFYDILGNEILNIDLEKNEGTEKIKSDDFVSGIYFYSLVVDNKKMATKKFVVANK